MRESDDGEKYVMSLDVGTTTIRSMVYNKEGVVMGTAATPVRYSQVTIFNMRQSKEKDTRTKKKTRTPWNIGVGIGNFATCYS